MRISDWSSDVFSSDLRHRDRLAGGAHFEAALEAVRRAERDRAHDAVAELLLDFQRQFGAVDLEGVVNGGNRVTREFHVDDGADDLHNLASRSEEHTSELQSLMRISYAVFCLKKQKQN